MRMWELIETAKQRRLTEAEKTELQKLFIRIAVQDAIILHDRKTQIYEN